MARFASPMPGSMFAPHLDAIEAGRGTMRYEPSLVDDWPLTHLPFGNDAATCQPCRLMAITALAAAATFWVLLRSAS